MSWSDEGVHFKRALSQQDLCKQPVRAIPCGRPRRDDDDEVDSRAANLPVGAIPRGRPCRDVDDDVRFGIAAGEGERVVGFGVVWLVGRPRGIAPTGGLLESR